MITTIDGPTASGKTTIARMLAQKLGYYYLSSGLLFRGLAYVLVHDFLYSPELINNPREHDIVKALDPRTFVYVYNHEQGEQLFVHGKNITHELRGPTLSQYASILGTHVQVRAVLAALQHHIANDHDLVAEGRDMGSAIFPHAHIKFFLTASLEVRAARWQKDQNAKGKDISSEEARQEIQTRDDRDQSRAVAPLCIPEGALIIDDSEMPQQQVVEQMIREIQRN